MMNRLYHLRVCNKIYNYRVFHTLETRCTVFTHIRFLLSSFLLFFLLLSSSFAQTVGIYGSTNLGVNSTGAKGNQFSVFDISSTTDGLLLPRMTTVQRDAIAPDATAASLLIYNTTNNRYEYYDGAAWVAVAAAGNGWSLTGNAGTVDGTNFIGTTDNIPFNIRVNNQKAGRIDNAQSNVFMGYVAGKANTTGNRSVFIGDSAGYNNNTGIRNIFIGYRAGYNSNNNYNLFMGYDAGYNNTSGSQNMFMGYAAGFLNSTGVNNHAVGYLAGRNNNASNNFFEGYYAGYENTSGTANTFLGFQAGYTGTPANAVTTGSNNTFLGYNTGFASATQRTNAAAIGYNAKVDADNALVLGGTGADAVNVGIGTRTPGSKLDVTTTALGTTQTTSSGLSLLNTTAAAAGLQQISPAIRWSGQGWSSFFFNSQAVDFRSYVVPVEGMFPQGYLSFGSSVDGAAYNDGQLVLTTSGQIGIGKTNPVAKLHVYGSGSNTTIMVEDPTSRSRIGMIGQPATGNNEFGFGNVALQFGTITDNTFSGFSEKMRIATNGNVGIGTTAPASMLSIGASNEFQVNSTGNIVKLNNVTTSFPAANASGLLKNDGAGTLTWEAAAAAGWSLTGNTGTVDGTNFIGTTDNIPFNIRVNNKNAARISSADNLFLGYMAGNNSSVNVIDNIAIGDSALFTQSFATAFSSENVAVGNSALFSNNPTTTTNGRFNTAIGTRAMRNNTTASSNTAIGNSSLYFNTTGNDNTASGYNSLYSNTAGYSNTAFGNWALYANTTGYFNTALGYGALYSNVTGTNATAVGRDAMLYANNTGTAFTNYNVAVGFQALRGSTTASANTGNNNTALGYQTLWSITSGDANTAVGSKAGYSNATGVFNTFLGSSAGYSNSNGSRNVFLGEGAGYTGTGISNNVFIGEGNGYFVTSGDNNVMVGYTSGGSVANLGSYNTFLGFGAKGDVGLTNATAIGKNAQATASNSLILGGTGADVVNVGIGTTAPKGKLHIVGDAALGDGTAANEGVVTVFLTNNTGAASVKGEIVIVDPALNNSFVKTTTAGHTSVIGVVYEAGIAAGQPCRIAISGIVTVIADAATTRGQHCITGTATAGAAGSVATPGSGTSIGVWLESVAVSAQGKVLLR